MAEIRFLLNGAPHVVSSADPNETLLAHLRSATIDDVLGILQIIEPLEEQGVLVRRSRERLETEIERFVVAEYDNQIIGCAAKKRLAKMNVRLHEAGQQNAIGCVYDNIG